MLCERAGIPETLRSLYARLMIVPPDTPLPMTMLKRLWNLPADDKAESTAALLESKVQTSIVAPQACCAVVKEFSCGLLQSTRTFATLLVPMCAAEVCCIVSGLAGLRGKPLAKMMCRVSTAREPKPVHL